MNCTLESAPIPRATAYQRRHPQVRPCEIKRVVVDGVRCGEVRRLPRDVRPWHAVLNVPTTQAGNFSHLAQGHGDTPEAAIADAIASGRRTVADYSAGLDRLAKVVLT